MADYTRSILRVVVAQICQTIGWHSINSTPLEFMVDLMQEYFLRVYRLSHQYAEVLGRTDVNLDDLGLAFQHMSIDIQQLAEYVKNVDSVACVIPVPKYPIPRENHLNFLKPGSREVVTRSMHIHEHLPAMYPGDEDKSLDKEALSESLPKVLINGQNVSPDGENSITTNQSPEIIFKRPGDPLSENSVIAKRTKVDNESRPLREIHSVMMTTSGFLSPAREGKLPEPRTPVQARSDSPPPTSYPMVPPELKSEKKIKKVVKKSMEDKKLDKENKKKNRDKDLFKADKITEPKPKKLASMKETAKLKPLKPGGGKGFSPTTSPTPPVHSVQKDDSPLKISKNSSPKVKSEKTLGPAPSVSAEKKEDNVDKLPSEPDKQKLNIFKKISKPRDEKSVDVTDHHHKHKDIESRESSPGLIIDEPNSDKRDNRMEIDAKREEKKVPHTPEAHVHGDNEIVDLRSPSSDVYMFDDMSPPGTPSTPKTPELNVPGPPPPETKKKRKEKSTKKKDNSKNTIPKDTVQKNKLGNDLMEAEVLGRPKTPEALETSMPKERGLPLTFPTLPYFPPFVAAPGLIPAGPSLIPPGPGLIPHGIPPLFPRFPLPLGRGVPNPPPIMHKLPMARPSFLPPAMKIDEFPIPKQKIPEKDHVMRVPSEPIIDQIIKTDVVEKVGKIGKIPKEKISISPNTKTLAAKYDAFPVAGPSHQPPNTKLEKFDKVDKLDKFDKLDKLDKLDKKAKKHKIDKKDKIKKKKDKKEKHKEKLEKNKDKKEKFDKIKEKKEKKDKRKEKEEKEKESESVPKITLKFGKSSPRPPTPDNPLMKKITIKPLVKKPEDIKRESSPELAKISALVTRPPKPKIPKVKTEKKEEVKDHNPAVFSERPVGTVVDSAGHQVWICPACGNQDDGSPMVGCDDCDGWYHWVCVGMQVPPADDENWYCRMCIVKQQELHHDKKKKKRKKKVKIVA